MACPEPADGAERSARGHGCTRPADTPSPLPLTGNDRSVREIPAIIARNNPRNPSSDNLRNNTGYGLQRLIEGLGHDCAVIAPAPIPRRPGERVMTSRRGAVELARPYRAGELTEIRTPDEAHEAMRDLVRARGAAVMDRSREGTV